MNATVIAKKAPDQTGGPLAGANVDPSALAPLNLQASEAPGRKVTQAAIAASLEPRDLANPATERVGGDHPLAMFFKKIAHEGISDGQVKSTGKVQMGEVFEPKKWGGDLSVTNPGKAGEALSVAMPPEVEKKISSIQIMDGEGTEVLRRFERGADGKFSFDRALTRGTQLFFEGQDGKLVSSADFVALNPAVSVSNGRLDRPLSLDIPPALAKSLERIHVVAPSEATPMDTILQSKDGQFRFRSCADRYPQGSMLVFELKDGTNVHAPLHATA